MSQHNKTDFKHFTKAEMDDGLRLHGLEESKPSQLSDGFRSGAEWGASAVLAALVQRAGVEAVATCHDDGHWTPHNTAAGRAFNDSLNKAGSCVQVYTHPAPAAPVVEQKPNCNECSTWLQTKRANKEWHEGVAKGRKIVAALHPTKPKGEQEC